MASRTTMTVPGKGQHSPSNVPKAPLLHRIPLSYTPLVQGSNLNGKRRMNCAALIMMHARLKTILQPNALRVWCHVLGGLSEIFSVWRPCLSDVISSAFPFVVAISKTKPETRGIQESKRTREPEHEGVGWCTACEGAHALI